MADGYLASPEGKPVVQQITQPVVEKAIAATKQEVEATVDEKIKSELAKAQALQQKEVTLARRQAMQMRIPDGFNQRLNPDVKPYADLPFSYLRRMATLYPIARACINLRIRQITQLDWDITTIDEIDGEQGFESQIKFVKEFFKHPAGHRSRLRKLLTGMVDDTLTIDAVCFELQRTRGGDFMHLVPVDPTTIVLRVTETGGIPMPPEVAYAQVIKGKKIAEFTTHEMLYDAMTTRTYSPYGLAPLESLIIQVESALRGALYNLDYLRESNVPEGFVTLPEEVAGSRDEVEQWQDWFDQMVAGDRRFMHRLKILPGEATYTAAKKPEDMSFERFELWLLQQTCAVFEVQPSEIGITNDINKATGESQREIGESRGLVPLSNFIKEIFDMVIQEELELDSLQWSWTNLNPVDRKEEVEISEKEINMGVRSVDEERIKQGLEPIGLDHYIKTSKGIILVKDLIDPNSAYNRAQNAAADGAETATNGDDEDKQKPAPNKKQSKMAELKTWRKCVINDIKYGRKIRTNFPSEFIDEQIKDEIRAGLTTCKTIEGAKLLFEPYINEEMSHTLNLFRIAQTMKRIEDADFFAE